MQEDLYTHCPKKLPKKFKESGLSVNFKYYHYLTLNYKITNLESFTIASKTLAPSLELVSRKVAEWSLATRSPSALVTHRTPINNLEYTWYRFIRNGLNETQVKSLANVRNALVAFLGRRNYFLFSDLKKGLKNNVKMNWKHR